MKLPPIKRILREDLKDAPSWITKLIDPINSFMDTSYQIFNKNVTFTENFRSFIKEFSYITPSTYPTGLSEIEFQNELKVKASGLVLAQIYDKTTYTPAPGPVFVPWVEDNGVLIISTITGLEASKTYLVRVVVF